MAAPTQDIEQDRKTGCYVYGIVPDDVTVEDELRGVGDPPGSVVVVRSHGIAALVSEIDLEDPLGRPDDLTAHDQVLSAVAGVAPVLPMRFGAVVADPSAVSDELLVPHHDEFAHALRELEGSAQFVVHGRYAEEPVLQRVLTENPDVAALRDAIRGMPEAASRTERIQLGELINQAVSVMRQSDTTALRDAVEPYCRSIANREPSHEFDAFHLAVLVELSRRTEFEDVLEEFARERSGWTRVRLLGPMAPYDFSVPTQPGG